MNKAHLSLYFFPSLFISFYFFSAYNVHSAYFVTDFANQGFYYIHYLGTVLNMLTTDSGLGNNMFRWNNKTKSLKKCVAREHFAG